MVSKSLWKYYHYSTMSLKHHILFSYLTLYLYTCNLKCLTYYLYLFIYKVFDAVCSLTNWPFWYSWGTFSSLELIYHINSVLPRATIFRVPDEIYSRGDPFFLSGSGIFYRGNFIFTSSDPWRLLAILSIFK